MFKTPIIIEEYGNSNRMWKLHATLIYEGNKQNFIIPKGFVTDFASIPKCFWWLISPLERHMKAAIVHDYLYQNSITSRKDADRIFRRMMKELRVGLIKRNLMFGMVRIFGWLFYKNK